MSRPLRIEFPNAIYHVTARGDRREPIYLDDDDRIAQLRVVAQAMQRFDAQVLAYCQMGNHYHLVLHTRQANLSRLMRHLNGVYTQAFNRRHGLVGHLFQGRFKAILVDRDAYLLALCRYVERNPVAAGAVRHATDWQWSSCRAHLGLEPTPDWLDSDGLHGYLLGRSVKTGRDRREAEDRYLKLITDESLDDSNFWQLGLRGQIYLGNEAFAQRMREQGQSPQQLAKEIPRIQRQGPRTWEQCLMQCAGDRNSALLIAYREGGLTMTSLARLTGLSTTHVSRLIARAEGKGET
jgi:REP element-mobilizing transposase RayT